MKKTNTMQILVYIEWNNSPVQLNGKWTPFIKPSAKNTSQLTLDQQCYQISRHTFWWKVLHYKELVNYQKEKVVLSPGSGQRPMVCST